MIKELEYAQVTIEDTYLNNAFLLERKYLDELSSDRLLAGFRETAGLPKKADRYPGWESTEIQGHTMGHYLSALSQAYGQTGDQSLLKEIMYILSELKACQAEDGFLFASSRELFDRIENKQPAWVPWYTMHKIMEGLLSAYHFTKNETAKEIMVNLGIWIYHRCMSWSQETRQLVLSVEYGGMNDCLYDLYLVTGDKRFLDAAHQFDEDTLFQALYEKKDILNGLHANTTIPKIVGALKRYVATGEKYYLDVAQNFWEIVTQHHTYITGGNSEWEHFGEPDILDDERTACNCETCNTYNMLKLTKLLFQITGEKKYADYDERTFLNAILSSQNPVTGMTTYFQPMATGFFKVYSTPFDRFWCCTGTGMENFTKLTEGIYFEDKGKIYINRFVSSTLKLSKYGIILQMQADFQKSEQVHITIERFSTKNLSIENNKEIIIAVRMPDWLSDTVSFSYKNALDPAFSAQEENGYLLFKANWNTGDELILNFPAALKVHTLPDNKNAVCFTYGPFVLSAGLGKEKMDMTVTGVDVLVPMREVEVRDAIVLEKESAESFLQQPQKYLIQTPGEAVFTLKGAEADRELVFSPHFARYGERYGIYFWVYEKDSLEWRAKTEQEKKKAELAKQQIDAVPIGNDQYELAHKIRGEKTDTARLDGHRYRYAREDGWFSYELKGEKGSRLCVTYYNGDAGIDFDIYINDKLFVSEILCKDEKDFYQKEYVLPEEDVASGIFTVIFRNKGKDQTGCCRIFDELYVKKK